MGKRHLKNCRILLRLTLLFLLYCHLTFTAEAAQNEFHPSDDKSEVGAETNLNNPITDDVATSAVSPIQERQKRPTRLLPRVSHFSTIFFFRSGLSKCGVKYGKTNV